MAQGGVGRGVGRRGEERRGGERIHSVLERSVS
jgi:hypothetical protein